MTRNHFSSMFVVGHSSGPRRKSFVCQSLHKKGGECPSWMFGSADRPWYQGVVVSMVKRAKRAIKFAVNNRRLSASEFVTVCIVEFLNERRIRSLPGADSY